MARIGLVAHDDKKDDLVGWAQKHRHKLSEHELWGTCLLYTSPSPRDS